MSGVLFITKVGQQNEVVCILSEKTTYWMEEWTKQLRRWKSWLFSGNPEQMMEVHRLWWTVIVFKCIYFFQLFDFYCLLVLYLLFFFENFYFDSFSLMTLIEKIIDNFYVG